MKKILLLSVVFLSTISLSAQRNLHRYADQPRFFIIERDKTRTDTMALRVARDHFLATHVSGFQQSHLPRFIVSANDGRFLLGIGGYVNFRTAYDFDGMVDNLDFVTGDIPVPASPLTRQKLYMGASTSRLFLKALARTKRLGVLEAYIETDFRGGDSENQLRLRLAYLSFKGLLLGQNITTFCDLNAAPTTVDFQGPNAYDLEFNTMIRYTHRFSEHWSMGVALEMPSLSSTMNAYSRSIPQRVPDLPLYVQWNWGRRTSSHLRLSGVFRDMIYYDTVAQESKDVFAWGAKFSGNIQITERFGTYFQGVCGQGIAKYIQDIAGRGLDLVPDPDRANRMQVLPMYGWFAAAQYNIEPSWFISGGYSQVRIDKRHGYGPDSQYRNAQYIFANTFYNLTPNCQIALEYLFGTRENMNKQKGHSNRIQAMIQYNF